VADPIKGMVELGQRTVLRGLLEVAKAALGPEMPDVPDEEAVELVLRPLGHRGSDDAGRSGYSHPVRWSARGQLRQ